MLIFRSFKLEFGLGLLVELFGFLPSSICAAGRVTRIYLWMESTLIIQLFHSLLSLSCQLESLSNSVDHKQVFVSQLVLRRKDYVNVAADESLVGSFYHFAAVFRCQLPSVLSMTRTNHLISSIFYITLSFLRVS